MGENAAIARACVLGTAFELGTIAGNAQTPVASSPTTATTGDWLAEVVVTAQRRAENAQAVPIAIYAISGEALSQAFGANNVETLQEAIPGLDISMDTGNTKIFLRGVGSTAVDTDNSVGVYLDGVYIAAQGSSFMSLANIDYVEVDKGPQGTLFGRNTTGGVIQIVTKTPVAVPSAELTLGYGNYNTFTLNFYGTSGIAPNLAADFAYYYNNQLDSPGMNVTTGTRNILRQNAEVIRSKWLWTPTDTTTVTVGLDYTQDRQALEWLHARYRNFPNDPSYVPASAGGNHLIAINGAGLHMTNAPDFSAYGAADYAMAVGGGMLNVDVNESYNAGYYWNPDNRLRQPAFALLGGYLKWTDANGGWSYRLWGNNLTSRHFYTYEDAFAFGNIYSAAMPATYGIAVERNF
jgi:outer membrane receptor protein involved in Fe transport